MFEGEFLFFEVFGGGVVEFEGSYGVVDGVFDFFFLVMFEFEGEGWVGDDFFDMVDVGFELLFGFEFFVEGFVVGFESFGICGVVSEVFYRV